MKTRRQTRHSGRLFSFRYSPGGTLPRFYCLHNPPAAVTLLFFALLLPAAGCVPQPIAEGTLKRRDLTPQTHEAPEPAAGQEKAAQRVTLRALTSYAAHIKTLDILVYSDDDIKALEAYPLRASNQIPGDFSTTVKLTPGDKTAIAIANCPYTLDPRKIYSYFSAEQLSCRLEDELPDWPLMSCVVNFSVGGDSTENGSDEDNTPAGSGRSSRSDDNGKDVSGSSEVTVEMELLPLRGEVIVSSVCSSVGADGDSGRDGDEGGRLDGDAGGELGWSPGGSSGSGIQDAILLENARVRLRNINTVADILRTGDFHPTETLSEGPYVTLPHAIGIYSALQTFSRLICYPFDGESPDAWTSAAQLELNCTIEGEECTYLFELPTVGRGCSVLVDIDVHSPTSASARTYKTDRLHF